jgi:glycosyltransferase involved in cell wall biosynthesis
LKREDVVVLIAGEPLWPATHGGTIRSAHLASALNEAFQVVVVQPSGVVPEGFGLLPLDSTPGSSRLAGRLTLRPRLGVAQLGSDLSALRARLERSAAVVCAHSYIAAVIGDSGIPTFIDLANVESERFRSFASSGSTAARLSATLEHLKARYWEPRAIRQADAVATLSEKDFEWVEARGGTPLLCPNGLSHQEFGESPEGGPVGLVGSFDYRPNREALLWYLYQVLPLIADAVPATRHMVVGRGAADACPPVDGLALHSDVESIDSFYESASIVVAPAVIGGGSQVKIAEAVAHGRCVVVAASTAASIPSHLRDNPLVVLADGPRGFADAVALLATDTDRRHALEREARLRPSLSWEDSFAPLVNAIESSLR